MNNNKDSEGVSRSKGVDLSEGVSRSDGVNWSKGVSWSKGVNGSKGVDWSKGVNLSEGVNLSYGVNWSDGVSRSYGVSVSEGVNLSKGVSESYGVNRSSGIYQQLFAHEQITPPKIFNKEVSQTRFDEVLTRINHLNNGWFPQFNNAFILYDANGKKWSSLDASQFQSQDPKEAWADMPKTTVEYIASLPEFDAEIFKSITGIDVSTYEPKEKMVTISVDGKSIEISRTSAIALNLIEE